jgi:hypothetical protein
MARLRREEEERSYQSLLHTSTYGKDGADKDDAQTMKEVNEQVSVIINILFSVIACAGGVWYVAKWWSTPWRLTLSMVAAAVVGIAEVVVYGGYIRRLSEAREIEKKKVERKAVVKTWSTADKAATETIASAEKADPPTNDGVRKRKAKKAG